MAEYPSGVYDPRTKENDPSVEYDADKKSVIFVEDVTKLDDEVVAIETELGASPSGAWSDIAAAIVDLAKGTITFVIDGGGSAITTGEKGYLRIPFDCEIERVTMLADQSGSIVVDIWKDTYANFPPTDADSITSSAPPTISSAQKSEDATLTDWTKAIVADSILAFNVDSCTGIERVTISLKIKKT